MPHRDVSPWQDTPRQDPAVLPPPQVQRVHDVTLTHFTLSLAEADNGKSYMDRHEWEDVGKTHDPRHRPGHIIWSEFLWPGDHSTVGGNGDRLRKDLARDFGPGSASHVSFQSPDGRSWIVVELALAFAAHLNPALRVPMLQIFRRHGCQILYAGETESPDVTTLTPVQKKALMMKWVMEELNALETRVEVVEHTSQQALERATSAETSAVQARHAATLALEASRRMTIADFVISHKLLRQFPEPTWQRVATRMNHFCEAHNLSVRKIEVVGKPWREENAYPLAAFEWLLRQKDLQQSTMPWKDPSHA